MTLSRVLNVWCFLAGRPRWRAEATLMTTPCCVGTVTRKPRILRLARSRVSRWYLTWRWHVAPSLTKMLEVPNVTPAGSVNKNPVLLVLILYLIETVNLKSKRNSTCFLSYIWFNIDITHLWKRKMHHLYLSHIEISHTFKKRERKKTYTYHSHFEIKYVWTLPLFLPSLNHLPGAQGHQCASQ